MTAALAWNGNTMGGASPRLKDDSYFTPDELALAICQRLDTVIGPYPAQIIEPSAGAGAFIRAAWKVWPDSMVCAVEPYRPELENDGNGGGRHFLFWFSKTWEETTCRPMPGPVLIVGNPPFSLAEDHVELSLRRLGHMEAKEPQPRWLSFLLRGAFRASQSRIDRLHLGLGGLRYVWHVRERPAFAGVCPECGLLGEREAIVVSHEPLLPKKKDAPQPRRNAGGTCIGSGKQSQEATDNSEYAVLTWQAGYRGDYSGGWLSSRGGR